MDEKLETLPFDDTAQSLPLGNGLIDSTQNVIIDAAENVSQVFDTAGKTVEAELNVVPFYGEVRFWIGMAFVLAVLVLLIPAYRYIKQALQNRVQKVIDDIDEARKLRDDAQNLLAEYERKFADMQKEADKIISDGMKSLKTLQKNETERVQIELENKQQEAERRIKTATEKAKNEINGSAAHLSVRLAQKAIDRYLQETDKSKLVDTAITELAQFIKK